MSLLDKMHLQQQQQLKQYYILSFFFLQDLPVCTDGRTVGEDGKYSEKMVVKNREGAYVAFSVYGVSEQSVIR